MKVTLTLTMDWLVYFYWLVEYYVFVYCQELKIRSHYEYFERLTQLEVDCTESKEEIISCQPIQVINPVLIEDPDQVTFSDLDEAAEGLFEEVQQELGLGEFDNVNPVFELDQPSEEIEYELDIDHGYKLSSLAEYGEEEDYIQMADLDEMEENSPTGYEQFASAKIADCINGPQQWVVTIVGMEESYIHVSDGKRIWINVGEKATKLKKGDVLILDVIRNGKNVTVDNIFRLEMDVSEDYVIPDEEYCFQKEQMAI